jgi:dihydrofolate synthase/folylpolyglutamate synthase
VLADVRDLIAELRAAGTLTAHPTFFEVTTAAAFELFRRARVDIATCEVGLGGRLDATNVLQPLATAITSIGFDHERYLGHTLREIAGEKAGIIKAGTPVIVGHMAAEALEAIEAIGRERHAPVIKAWDVQALVQLSVTTGYSRIELRTALRDYGELEIGLPGEHQISNALVAVRVLEALAERGIDVPGAAIRSGLASVRWPGRLETLQLPNGREAILDAAHNPQGAAALGAFLSATARPKIPLVIAVMRDKDVAGILGALAPAISALIATRASNPRTADPQVIAEQARLVAPQLPIEVRSDLRGALDAAWHLSPKIVIAGSIFLLGDVMNELGAS